MVLLQQELERQERNALFRPEQGEDEESRADEDILTVEPVVQKWILNPNSRFLGVFDCALMTPKFCGLSRLRLGFAGCM